MAPAVPDGDCKVKRYAVFTEGEMYFCESCNLLMQDNICGNCGKKKLRTVQDDDFCFFVALGADKAKYFEENLKLQAIPVALIGSGLNLQNRTSGIFKIFIPYCCFDRAKEIYTLLFGEK